MDKSPPPATKAPYPATGLPRFVAPITLGALLGAGPALLAFLSRFGPTPVESLPLLAAALYGVLFVGSIYDVSAPFNARVRAGRVALVGLTAVAAGAITTLFPLGDWRYLIAPATAIAGSLAVTRLSAATGGLVAAGSVYVAATLLANFTLDSFIPVGNFFLVNVGTLFFGLTFTQRDRLHRYGRRAVYGMILTAATTNVLLAASLGTPLRFVVVSFVTILLAEAADTEVYQRLQARRWLVRVASSNAVSAPLDTVLFTLLAFWGQPYATPGWLTQVIVTDVIVKYLAGLLAALGMLALLRSVWPQAHMGDVPPLTGGPHERSEPRQPA
ncbi:MAG: VUT family protein [Trueperaceae bacterium]